MASCFNMPDWCSWENQGISVAVADITGNGHLDLVMFLVDRQPGENQGLYRIGRDIDADGQVRGGWTPWRTVPDWLSSENQGAGLAITDVTGSGQPDLLAFAVHTRPGHNQGLYRLGRDLDAAGNVTGGWGPWNSVPGAVSGSHVRPFNESRHSALGTSRLPLGDVPAPQPKLHRLWSRIRRLLQRGIQELIQGYLEYGWMVADPMGYSVLFTSGWRSRLTEDRLVATCDLQDTERKVDS